MKIKKANVLEYKRPTGTIAVNQVKEEAEPIELAYSAPSKTKQITPEIIQASVKNESEALALKQDYLCKSASITSILYKAKIASFPGSS